MRSSDTAAQLIATVARDVNPSSAIALKPPNTSAGIRDSTDTSFVTADFISEAEKSKRFLCKDWLASSLCIANSAP